jgi:transcriptional regulator with XRE-family HTH domain
MIVGNMIRKIRENAGLTQEQFTEKLAISRQAVSKWERGVALPDIENIMFISDHFDVSLDTIVKGDKKMTNIVIADSKNAKLMNKLFIGIIVVATAIMENLGDKTALGPMLALMTLSLLYCGILYMVIIIPFTVFINKKS